ncbi:MAG: flagellar hook-basal body protein [Ruminococcaceae bacterium]|nr:flagellar hook-basal body protein [Oscillospiraceae bacterium]
MNAIYTAASGLRSQQIRLDTIGDNVANVNTIGYKSTRVDFKDTLYTIMKNPEGGTEEVNLRRGTGVMINATNIDFSESSQLTTDAPLDFAINGPGFFVVESQNGERFYTRSGCFNRSVEADGDYLVTQQGYYVLDEAGRRITLPESGISVAEGGVLSADHEVFGNMAIVGFANENGLAPAGSTCFTETEASGEPFNLERANVRQGVLENSNVDLAQEMTLMIRTQRAYSLASRALRTADDMDGLVNSLR